MSRGRGSGIWKICVMRPGPATSARRGRPGTRGAHVVGHGHDGLAALLPDALDVVVELVARERVERRERLIHQKDLRVGGQRTC